MCIRDSKQGQRVSLVIEDTGKGPQASQVQPLREEEGAPEHDLSP